MESKTEMGCISTTKGLQKSDGVGLLNYIQSCSQLFAGSGTFNSSAISETSDNSAINYVYQRKRLLKNPSPVFPAPTTENINFVYERRKHQKSDVSNKTDMVSANMPAVGACAPAIRSDNLLLPSCHKTKTLREREYTRVSSMEQSLTMSEMIDGYVTEYSGFDVNDKLSKTIELYIANDSCSSSMLNMDRSFSPSKCKVDDTDECASSDTLVVDVTRIDQSLMAKGLCVSVLRSNGLLSNIRVDRSDISNDDAPSCSGCSCSRSCIVCGMVGTTTEMLICDECEEAFHVSCFNPRIKNPLIDDWYCQLCSRKKHNFLKERGVRNSSIMMTGKGLVTSDGDSSRISLEDSEPYITGVRVGKGFQAIVPEWCGPLTGGFSSYPEPMELDLSEPITVKPRKPCIGNWLQCRDIIVGIADDIDGTICGKWRRAPLFEIQTAKWDCFSSIFWDPTHADCAAPQELGTEEVLRQLKYIEMLRPRLEAKKRKLEPCRAGGSEEESKRTGSIDIMRNS